MKICKKTTNTKQNLRELRECMKKKIPIKKKKTSEIKIIMLQMKKKKLL